ncbi:MAG: SCO6880 family protein [Solirubrobacteraceae bacterium]
MSTTSEQPVRRSHRLGDEEPRVLMGLGWPEITVLGVLLGVGLMVLSVRKDTLGVSVGIGTAALGATLGWGHHAGRSLAVWTATHVRHALAHLLGAHRWARQVTDGHQTHHGLLRDRVELPGELGRLHLLETTLRDDGSDPRVGVVHDRRADTFTATLLVRSTSNFGLLGHADQDRRLADWAGALEELARDQSPVRRIAWIERTLPEPTNALADELHAGLDPQLSLDLSPVRSYLELLDQAGTATDHHELLVSIQITGRRARRHAKGRGWTRHQTALRVLAGEVDLAAQALQQAGLDVRRPLDVNALITTIRLGLDPFSRHLLHTPTRVNDPTSAGDTLTPGDIAGPASGARADPHGGTDASTEIDRAGELAGGARQAAWDHVLWDGSEHVTCWIARWPRQPVRSMFLAPLLMGSQSTRAVGVVMELLGPERGLRQAETTVADDESNESLRWRGGRRTTRQTAKREQANRSREDELADGHIDIRWAGYVSIAVPTGDPHERHQAVDRIKAQAARCGLRLEVMYGQQPEALTFLLPLARGLR